MDELKSILTKLGKNITKTSTDIIKNTKLNMELSSQEEKLKKIYMEIGQKVYEIYSYGGSIGKFFDEKYIEMLEIEKDINLIKQKIEQNKNSSANVKIQELSKQLDVEENKDIIVCSNCNEKNDVKNNFCIKCGRTL